MMRPIETCFLMAWLAVAFTAPPVIAQQNVVIVLDNSGSMSAALRSDPQQRKMEVAKTALSTVLKQLPSDANVGLCVLNATDSHWAIPLGPIDKAQLQQQIDQIIARGRTPLGLCLKMSADVLLQAREKQRYGTYRLLVITDGQASDAALMHQVVPTIVARGLEIDAIGVDMYMQHELAQSARSYRNANSPESLHQAISAVLAEASADDGASDQLDEDFELLAGIDGAVVPAILTQLAKPNNEPLGKDDGLGDTAPAPHENQNHAAPAPHGNHAASNNPSAPNDSARKRHNKGKSGAFRTVIMLFFGVILLRVLMQSTKRPRR